MTKESGRGGRNDKGSKVGSGESLGSERTNNGVTNIFDHQADHADSLLEAMTYKWKGWRADRRNEREAQHREYAGDDGQGLVQRNLYVVESPLPADGKTYKYVPKPKQELGDVIHIADYLKERQADRSEQD